MADTRMPTQKRSIEKRNRIIDTGFKLMCERGYHNVTTNDIAEEANVSIGIIYQYFNDKKEIFLEGVKNYSSNILFPIMELLNEVEFNLKDFDKSLEKIIDTFINAHTISSQAHKELIATVLIDDDVAEVFTTQELAMTQKIVEILKTNGCKTKHLEEKVHICYKLIDDLCHEIVYHKHSNMNYDVMKKEVINIITKTIKGTI